MQDVIRSSELLWLVQDGAVYACGPGTEVDGDNSVLVLAATALDALKLASRYDAGELQPDNQPYAGRTVCALRSTAVRAYRVYNRLTGADLGVHVGDGIAAAHEAMCRDAGYEDAAECAGVLGYSVQELIAELEFQELDS
jgi:hypothetical protein